MPSPDASKDEKSKRPADTKFKQQKLPAWKPILTPKTVLPNIAVIGILFLAVGIALFLGSESVKEQTITYTDCLSTANQMSCGDLLNDFANGYTNLSEPDKRCQCEVRVNLTEGFNSDETFVYYALENFYQNHRQYVSSRWDPQLRAVTTKVAADCSPLDYDETGKAYAPCGLVANSLFNDTIQIYKCNDSGCTNRTNINLNGKNIAWKSDRTAKFNNPTPPEGKPLCQAPGFVDGAKLPNWPVPACQLGTNVSVYHAQSPEFGSSGEGYENEDLIVWMRTAALPNFRKLYRRVEGSLPDAEYVFVIGYNYPVKNFNGEKKIVISTLSWQGGSNPFLGICYLVVGSLCMLTVAVFLVLIRYKGRELGSDDFLKWDN
eukprot:m.57417 g.57417  ORF g.57417 m.57417 type:complete len:376 (-) comp13081_c0_seq1:279-1406(-)